MKADAAKKEYTSKKTCKKMNKVNRLF